jgi:hypothetical protein
VHEPGFIKQGLDDLGGGAGANNVKDILDRTVDNLQGVHVNK